MSLHRLTLTSVLAVAAASFPGYAQSPARSPFVQSTGALLGEIRNASGVAQMGATVFLYDRYDNLVRKAISTEEGRFAFAGLAPDSYSIRVTLASFFPAMKRNIMVLAGSENLLQVSMAAVLSTVDVAPGAANKATLMSDEWKWVLRSSQNTRPVLRFLPIEPGATESASMFSDTTGVVRVSGGDSNLLNSSLQQDMGTAFAVETTVNSTDRMRVSGTLGYAAASGLPSAGLRTTYLRKRPGSLTGPEVSLTVRQAFFPAAINGATATGTPVLRTASLSSIDSLEILDSLKLEYGASIDSITLYGRMNYVSPFARATYTNNGGVLKVAYSAGFTPAELLARQPEGQTDLSQDIFLLAQAPRISRRDNQAAVERAKNYEASYEVNDGDTTFYALAFREDVSNAAFLMSGSIGLAGTANLLPDLNTRGTVYNGGSYQRTGLSLGFAQAVNEYLDFAIAGGQAGALVSDGLTEGSLRSHLRTSPRPWVTMRGNALLPRTGTRLGASYGWTDFRALMPVHQSLTGHTDQQLGWNVSCRQPLPSTRGIRMEIMAELRNMLAQGYLGLDGPDGQKAILTNTPRQVRGGLSFIF